VSACCGESVDVLGDDHLGKILCYWFSRKDMGGSRYGRYPLGHGNAVRSPARLMVIEHLSPGDIVLADIPLKGLKAGPLVHQYVARSLLETLGEADINRTT